MYQNLLHFLNQNVAELGKPYSTFILHPDDFGSGKYSFILCLFLSIQLLKELSCPFHLTYNLSPFLLLLSKL